MIGLFAIPEVMLQLSRSRMMKGRARIGIAQSVDPNDRRLTWAEFKANFRHMVRGDSVGLREDIFNQIPYVKKVN